MQNWADDGSGDCRAEDDRRDAVAVCGLLGIPFHFRDFSSEYWQGVFEHFLAEYAAGRTPNPDVLCNREVKFKHFRCRPRAGRRAHRHRPLRARSPARWPMAAAAWRRPLQGPELLPAPAGPGAAGSDPVPDRRPEKTDLRRIARDVGLPTHAKKDSTGICFIGERDFRDFLGRYLPAKPGQIVDPADGTVIAEHPGVFYFTLGQREGLNIGGVRGRPAAPWYVVGKDVASNVLYVDRTATASGCFPTGCVRKPRTGLPARRRHGASNAPPRPATANLTSRVRSRCWTMAACWSPSRARSVPLPRSIAGAV